MVKCAIVIRYGVCVYLRRYNGTTKVNKLNAVLVTITSRHDHTLLKDGVGAFTLVACTMVPSLAGRTGLVLRTALCAREVRLLYWHVLWYPH